MTPGVQGQFRSQAESWLCDGYCADIRYWISTGDKPALWAATVFLTPLKPSDGATFSAEFGHGKVGRILIDGMSKEVSLQFIDQLLSGYLRHEGISASLAPGASLTFDSEGLDRDVWFHQLHVAVKSGQAISAEPERLMAIDHALRTCVIPFDGMNDVCASLGFKVVPAESFIPRLDVFIGPPVDLFFEDADQALSDGKLSLKVFAHPKFDTGRMSLGIRVVPSEVLAGRIQVADTVMWGDIAQGKRVGQLEVDAGGAISALSMLSAGGVTVRRHWFVDKKKSPNARFVSGAIFDKDLRRLRASVFDLDQAKEFEKGIASLATMLGFAVDAPVETEAPDLIAHAPSGRILLMECTLKVSDSASKAGKLADRRAVLEAFLRSRKDFREVFAVLVTRQSEENPGVDRAAIRERGVTLFGREMLEKLFYRVELVPDPDMLLNELVEGSKVAG